MSDPGEQLIFFFRQHDFLFEIPFKRSMFKRLTCLPELLGLPTWNFEP
jgi:hypothetical protein